MRFQDVSSCKSPCPTADFQETALAMRGDKRSPEHGVDMSTITSILKSAGKKFHVVTIHSEVDDPDVCFIGRVLATEKYALDTITRVDFGGGYEGALALVANAGAPSGQTPS
ncbi:MAG: hypothetical protein HQ519_04595 [Planctomycetes bacterium]|nr:hypothetical protein [Planctomycetota bacterium]